MSQWSSDVFTPVLSLLRQAFAATPEGARALARSQSAPAASEDAALRRLPVAALRLEPEAEMALRRAGLKSIGDLAARPATPLAARFGEDATKKQALVLGLTDSRITPSRTLPAPFFARRFAAQPGPTGLALRTID